MPRQRRIHIGECHTKQSLEYTRRNVHALVWGTLEPNYVFVIVVYFVTKYDSSVTREYNKDIEQHA